jgi:hypothetical protein
LADERRGFGDALGRLSADEHTLGRALKPLPALGRLSKRVQALSRWQERLSEERLPECRQVAVPVRGGRRRMGGGIALLVSI